MLLRKIDSRPAERYPIVVGSKLNGGAEKIAAMMNRMATSHRTGKASVITAHTAPGWARVPRGASVNFSSESLA